MNFLTLFVVAIVGPCILAWLTGRQRSREKHEDWLRQDEVAARVEKVAKDAANNAKVANTTLQSVAADVKIVVEGNDKIHTLVNSNLTSLMESKLVVLENLVELQRATKVSGKAISKTEQEITTLRSELSDRVNPRLVQEPEPEPE